MTATRTTYEPVRLDTPQDFLLALMRKHSLRSYEQVAAFLLVKRQTVYNYRDGETGFSADVCAKVATALELPLELVLARMAEFRAASDEERAAWRRLSRAVKAAGFKALAVVAIGAAASSPDAQAFNNNGIVERSARVADVTEIHIAPLRRRRERGRVLARFIAWLATCGALSFSL